MDTNFNALKNQLAKGKVTEVINALSDIAKSKLKHKRIQKELHMLKYRWGELAKEQVLNTISSEQADIKKNQITSSLFGLIDRVEEYVVNGPPPAEKRKKTMMWVLPLLLILGVGATYTYYNFFKPEKMASFDDYFSCPFADTSTFNILITPFKGYSESNNNRSVENAIREGLVVRSGQNSLHNSIQIQKDEINLDANLASNHLTTCNANLLIWGSYDQGDSIEISLKYIADELVSEYLDVQSMQTTFGTVKSLMSLERGEIISEFDDILEVSSRLITGINLIKENKLDSALDELGGIKGKSGKVQALIEKTKGDLHLLQGDYDKAIDSYEKSIPYGSQYEKAKAYNNIGYAKYKKGDVSGARSDFNKANELDGNNQDISQNFEIIEKQINENTTKISEVNQVAKPKTEVKSKIPSICGNFAECFNKGNDLRDAKKYNEAMNYYKAAKTFNPKVQEPYLGLGWVHADLGFYDTAIDYYEQAIKVEPDFGNGYADLYEIYYKVKKDYKKAEEYNQKFTQVTNGKRRKIQRTFDN